MLGRFLKDCRGGVAPMVGLIAIPLMGSVGAAVDYSRASAARTAMQAALDSTALAITKQNSSTSQASAQQIFSALFARTDVQNVMVNVGATNAGGSTTVNLSASAVVKTTFLEPMGFPTININVHATAFSNNDGLGCVLSLSRTAVNAISAVGSTSVALKGCSLYDNSNSSTALSIGGSATLSALSIGVVGKTAISSSNVTATQGISTGVSPIADPYADIVVPAFSGCTQTNYTAKSAVTIDPGVYCDGLSANAGANLTLNPGTYIIDRGSFSINGGATVTGQGVTLVFTSSTGTNWPTATINGGATINLTPPNSGPTAGIVILGDRQMPTDTSFKFTGGSTQTLGGAIYMPAGAITFSGGMGTSTSCTQIIGDTVSFSGNSNVAINCSAYKVRPFSSSVVRLSS